MPRPNSKKPLTNSDLPPAHKRICKRFRELRLKEGLSQEEYGKRLKMSLSAIKSVETGRFLPQIDTLKMMKKEFGISYNYLIDGKD